MTVKITALELYDFKKVRAFQCEPAAVGLTVIGGKSRAGKTSIPDGVAWCLGGDRRKPEKPNRDGAAKAAELTVTLSNGLVVTRKGKNGTLKVTDPNKKLGNQSLLNEFVSQWALDGRKLLHGTGKERVEALLQIIGVGEELKRLDTQYDDLYTEREAHGRVTTQKEKYAAELPFHKDTPAEETSASALIEEIQAVNAANAENAEQRRIVEMMVDMVHSHVGKTVDAAESRRQQAAILFQAITTAEQVLADAKRDSIKYAEECRLAENEETGMLTRLEQERDGKKTYVDQLTDQPTDALQEHLDKCEKTNARVRANAEKKAATTKGILARTTYVELTDRIEQVRAARIALLDNADLPLPGLGIAAGDITYEDQPWGNMATSDQMKTAAAISAKEKPECGFVLSDGTETMDRETLEDFGKWAEEEDLQVICTRVSTGDECTLIIEDGAIVEE